MIQNFFALIIRHLIIITKLYEVNGNIDASTLGSTDYVIICVIKKIDFFKLENWFKKELYIRKICVMPNLIKFAIVENIPTQSTKILISVNSGQFFAYWFWLV